MTDAPERPAWVRGAIGWALVAATLAYAAFVFYAFGPYPNQVDVPWWQPRGFLRESSLLLAFGENPLVSVAALAAPAALLAAGVFALSGSALARVLALGFAVTAGLFLFYGLRPPGPQIWNFFGWRGSAVMIVMAFTLAAAAIAPVLAASWIRLGWPLRAALYLPLFAAVVVAARNTTGTNPSLAFNISPWPVVTVFGFDLLATLWAGLLGCVALVLASWRLRSHRPAVAAPAGLAALALPVAWVGLDLGGGLLLLGAAVALGAAALAGVARAAGNLTMGLRSASGHVAVGTLLLAIPLLAGQACVRLDYSATRDGRAQAIIDALARFYEREGVYPEALAELVEARDLVAIPRPRIGFTALEEQEFIYQNFGTDYLLEFAAPGWTQCGYNPPWDEGPDEEELEQEELEEGEALPGAWSCPSQPPELW